MGIANAVTRLKDSKAKSKVIILLTDGSNNREMCIRDRLGYTNKDTSQLVSSVIGVMTQESVSYTHLFPRNRNISLTLRATPKVSEKTNELCISSPMPYILISFSKTKPIFAT